MINYVAILAENPVGVLATQDGEGVRTRVFQYLFSADNKVYFCTDSEKPVYAQLQANPHVSFCIHSAEFNPVLSVNGKAVFVDDIGLKRRALEENPPIKEIYDTPKNPTFKIFYIAVADVETFSLTEGARIYRL